MEQKLKALNKPGNGIQLISGSSRIVITNINKLNLQLSNSMERKAWTQQEDNILRMIIEVKKIKKWSSIARMMEIEYGIMGRTGKQCRERWHNKLDPNINVDNWSRQQQELLFKYHNQYGNKWAKIAKVLQGRSDNCIKNHFYSTLRKAFRGVNKYITENKKRSELRPFKDNVLTKIILLAEQFFEKKIDASDQQLQKCIQIKNSLVEYVLQSDNFSSQKMEQLIQKIAGLSKNLKIKKPKKKKRVFMDLEESIEQELQISEEKSVKVIPSIEQKPKPPQKNSFRLCDIRLTEVKQEQQPAQDFIPKEFLPHQIFNKSPVLMPAMPTLNFFSQRASNEMLLRQSTNLQGSGQFFIFNLSPFVHNNRPNPEMDQSTGLISNSLNFENLWDSGRFSESQLLISTQAPQAPQATAPAPPAPAQQASVGSNSNVYIPIPKMPNLRFEI